MYTPNTIIKKLQETGLPYYLAKFVDWYMTEPAERQPWEELAKCDENFRVKQTRNKVSEYTGEIKTLAFAEENWLPRTDVQEGIKVWMAHHRTLNTYKIYKKMLDKAMNGDVSAAKWVQDFHESKFFDEEGDEINEFLNNVSFKKPKKG